MKRLLLLAALLAPVLSADAYTTTTNGVTWTYIVSNGKASIGNGSSSAIRSSTTGAVTIPSTLGGYPVASIGMYAFSNCSGLTSVTIGNGVTNIGSYAFEGCSGLTSVTIPDSVTGVGYSAFRDCSELTSITIPNGVTSIGDCAFYNCSGLMSVTIPDSVKSIGSSAFNNCSGLMSVMIGNGVTSIGYSAFEGCSGLTSIVVDEDNPVYDSRDNCNAIVRKSYKALIVGCCNTTIPDGVTSIGDYAFDRRSGLMSVTIPDSVTRIGNYAFRSCSGLSSIAIPDSVTNIGERVFSGCSGLTNAVIGSGVTSIEYQAFCGCFGLTSVTIPGSVTSIGSEAFYGCSGLTSITIPDSVTSIGSSAFYNCSGLMSIAIPDGVTSIGSYAFYNCSGVTAATIPDSVTSIGKYVFSGCSGIKDVAVPGHFRLSSIFPSAYKSITNAVIADSVTSIGSYAFYNCSGLMSIAIPDGVTSIGEYAFSGCSGLMSITIPDGVTSIGAHAFSGCSGMTSVTIPDSVTSIEGGAFSGCSGLTSITIPDGITSIGGFAFSGCSGLMSITIPDGVTSIGEYAFYGCSGLTSITIPDGVASIGNYAFEGCSGLTSVTIGNGVTSIGEYAFSSCSSRTEVHISDLAAWCGISFGNSSANPCYYAHRLFLDGEIITNLMIPDGVTSIGDYAFDRCFGLTSVTIPDGVTSIGEYAFSGCSDLMSVAIPDGVTSIGEYAFSGCTGLTSVMIPDSVTNIGASAFSGCTGIESVVIGDGLTTIGQDVFAGCEGIRRFVVGDSLVSMQGLPFGGALESVEIGRGVAAIEARLFSGCTGLTSIAVADGVGRIGASAFSGCSGLMSVEIGDAVTNIGANAFSGCSWVSELVVPGDVTKIGTGAFSGCSGLARLVLPSRFRGATDGMAIPEGCFVEFYDTVRLGVYSDHGMPFPRVGSHPCILSNDVECTAPAVVVDGPDGSVRHFCTGWIGTGSVPQSGSGTNVSFRIEMNSNIRWNWRTENRIDWTVDMGGLAVESGSEWWEEGETAVIHFGGGTDFRQFEGCSVSGDSSGVSVDLENRVLSVPAGAPKSVTVTIETKEPSDWVESGGAPAAWTLPAGDVRWSIRADATASDGWSLKSDPVEAGGVASVEATVEGAGELSFDWRISSARGHYAKFYLDGEQQRSITRSTSWATVTLALGDGPHVLRWTYEKGAGATAGDDAAFLDNVCWRPTSIEEALDAGNLVWTTSVGSPWRAVVGVSADGEDAARSGPAQGAATSRLSTSLEGAGTLAWKWMAETGGTAGVDVFLDGEWVEDVFLEGSTGWLDASLEVEGNGRHVVTFEFWNEGTTTPGDAAWIDCVSWEPDSVWVEGVEIPVDWLRGNAGGILSAAGGDYAAAARGTAANGRDKVWECYVSGVDPEDAASRFEAVIGFDGNGEPVVTWTPDLGAVRDYAVDGKESLLDEWGVCDGNSRFFRVRVTIPGGFGIHTIMFDTAGGGRIAPISAAYGAALAAPADPEKAGYTFAGWKPGFPLTMPARDLLILALWTPNLYTITFDTDGGSVVASITAAYGTSVTAPNAPAKTGYAFAGWSPAFPATMPLNGAALVARWMPKNYTITFNTGSGSIVAPITAAYGSSVTAPAAPTKEGFMFAGWNPAFPATMPLNGATLVAQWTPKNYTISFDTGDGSVVAPITAAYSSVVSQPAAPTKAGYDFAGWSPAFPATMPLNGATLVAQWTPKNYTISFDTGNGSAVAPITAAYNSAVTAPVAPKKEGFTFAGWSPAFPTTMPLGGATLVAQWTPKNYTISFDTGEGSVVAPIMAAYGSAVTAPANPTKEGFTFSGWSPAFPATMPLGGATLVAQWTPKNYTISFDTGDGSVVAPITAAYGSILTAPAAPTKEGFTFVGWLPTFPATMPLGGATLVAQWKEPGYTVRFDANGGTGTMEDLFLSFGETNELPTLSFELDDHFFTGWSRSANGSGEFPDRWSVSDLTADDSVTLYATWGDERVWSYSVQEGAATITGYNRYGYGSTDDLVPSIIGGAFVTSIGNDAFWQCSGLTSIIIPNSVTSIGNGAFAYCYDLASVTIPNSVTNIGAQAFEGCSLLTEITIPDSVTSIGSFAFYGCSGLTIVSIGSGLASHDNLPVSVEEFRVSEASESLSSIDGVLFSKDGQTLLIYPGKRNDAYSIPDGVTSLADYSFSECSGLESIAIPGSVTNVGAGAFYRCSGLTTVMIESSAIGRQAFSDCFHLSTVVLGNGVTNIGDYAFSGCSELTSVIIPDGVTSIGEAAFDYCSGLTSVIIPNSVTSVGGWAFADCSAIRNVIVPGWLRLSNVFSSSYQSITNAVVAQGATNIAKSAFSNCSSLTSVTIPDSVTDIGIGAFNNCPDELFDTNGISGVKLVDGWVVGHADSLSGDLDLIGARGIAGAAFSGCSELTSIKIPDGVTSIGDRAFFCCSGLTSITIPDGVTSIGEEAFESCSGLTSITIPDGVTSIGEAAFEYCSGLTSVIIPNSVTSVGGWTFASCSAIRNVIVPGWLKLSTFSSSYRSITNVVIAQGSTAIADSAFYNCSGLTSIAIPDSVTSVGTKAFFGCSSMSAPVYNDSATFLFFVPNTFSGSFLIPDGVTIIGNYAFYRCRKLTSIIIPSSVTNIGNNAFYDCSGLTSITIPNGVTHIGDSAFYGCSGLTSITIPDGVTRIGDSAFLFCSGLTSITIPDGVTHIGDFAFDGCSGLTSITIPDGVTFIGDSAFYGCYGLTSITIPGSVTNIGNNAFYDCSELTSITIPNGVTHIGDSAFYGCSGLTSITIPDGVTSIGESAFLDCSCLMSLEIPDSVTSIGGGAFLGCSGLTSLAIPDSVTSIGDYAFDGCYNLTSLSLPGRFRGKTSSMGIPDGCTVTFRD